MSALEIAAALGVLAGAATQSATGFGYALVAAPLLFAAAGPQEAVGLLLVTSLGVNLMTLGTERRRPSPSRRDLLALLGWSVPGMAAGVVVLREVDAGALQVLLTVAVVISLVVQRRAARTRRHADSAPAWAPPAAGLAAGVLTTTTTTSGPPMVLLLLGRGLEPGRIRDTLTAAFIGLAILGSATLAVAGVDRAVPDLAVLAALLPLVAVGHVLGRPVFARLARGRYEEALVVLLTVSAAAGLATTLL